MKGHLLRVEQLSRYLDFGNNDDVRQQLACVIDVDGCNVEFIYMMQVGCFYFNRKYQQYTRFTATKS